MDPKAILLSQGCPGVVFPKRLPGCYPRRRDLILCPEGKDRDSRDPTQKSPPENGRDYIPNSVYRCRPKRDRGMYPGATFWVLVVPTDCWRRKGDPTQRGGREGRIGGPQDRETGWVRVVWVWTLTGQQLSGRLRSPPRRGPTCRFGVGQGFRVRRQGSVPPLVSVMVLPLHVRRRPGRVPQESPCPYPRTQDRDTRFFPQPAS